ncbi:Protein of unknown function [Gryllus bimaculatus]|nr:Protein of unknown function [Gryllus bimaculatus]
MGLRGYVWLARRHPYATYSYTKTVFSTCESKGRERDRKCFPARDGGWRSPGDQCAVKASAADAGTSVKPPKAPGGRCTAGRSGTRAGHAADNKMALIAPDEKELIPHAQGFRGRDGLLLPLLLLAALAALALLAAGACIALRRRRASQLRRQAIGEMSSDLQSEDKSTLLLPDGSEED